MSNSGIYEEDFEGSDHESLYADSPSDGYFTQREFPTQTFVEQSSVQSESEAKAREAAESRAASSESTPPSTSPTSSTRSPVWADEVTPLLDAGPAPPDYYAATAHRNGGGSAASYQHGTQLTTDEPLFPPTSYGTIDRGRPGGDMVDRNVAHQWRLGGRNNQSSPEYSSEPGRNPFSGSEQPQSMRDQTDEEHGLLGSGQPKRGWRQRAGWSCKPARLVNILLGLAVVAVIVLLALFTKHQSHSDSVNPSPEDDDRMPAPNATEPQPGPAHPISQVCAFKYFTEAMQFTFKNVDDFALSEVMDPELYMTGGISGNVWIAAAPPEQEADIVVWVSYASTEPWTVANMDYYYAHGTFGVRFPTIRGSHETRVPNPCMDVAIGVYLKSNLKMNDFNITTQNLNVQAGQGPSGHADYFAVLRSIEVERMSIKTGRGDVTMAHASTREMIIETHSGHIEGTYGLEDLLSVRTYSGQIEIKVAPREADKDHPAPAVFNAFSHSGGVTVGVASYGKIIARDYQTKVETHSSSIQGNYIFSSKASFVTQSGSIEIDLLPYFDENWQQRAPPLSANLWTESNSGHTEFRLLPPPDGTVDVIKNLRSSHHSGSGELALVYPQAWEGTIEGVTHSGGITLRGKDIKTYYDGNPASSGRRIVARKGYADSKLGFESRSGGVKLTVGDV
ncbi:hypothetical protein LTR56_000831 [Elasticomyces elasticus]|nr:hypothetical protein LTR22_018642 [Elasticomyces elasticus]KAK3660455.1 hypothetical protein LTR56_000831 [Elasticomyces elasticus]KAK4912257.1 hypothetical protein LTR49_019258 [Elasticomyces elasticus]KAK5751809.1 hypothetical protein LTS12_018137 [Elasticomyces elasticus]